MLVECFLTSDHSSEVWKANISGARRASNRNATLSPEDIPSRRMLLRYAQMDGAPRANENDDNTTKQRRLRTPQSCVAYPSNVDRMQFCGIYHFAAERDIESCLRGPEHTRVRRPEYSIGNFLFLSATRRREG